MYHDYAVFVERQYHAMTNSPDNLRWRILAERKKQEVARYDEQLRRLGRSHPDHRVLEHARGKAQDVLDQDSKQYNAHNDVRYAFLRKAIEMHSRSLEVTDSYDDDACIRLCSLWFANFDYSDLSFHDQVTTAIKRVPSHKFVFLTRQLSARLSKAHGTSSAAQTVFELVLRMCQEHPFHCFYSVFCLKGDSLVKGRRSSSRHDPTATQADRSIAAAEIFSQLQQGHLAARCNDVERVCVATHKWAKVRIESDAHQKAIPSDQEILKLREVHVPVITAYTPVEISKQYEHCVWIKRYEATYSTAGGVNLPKIVVCLGSDGCKYKQLVSETGASLPSLY